MLSYPLSQRTRFSTGAFLAVFGLVAVLLSFPVLNFLSTSSHGSLANAPAVSSTFSQLPLIFTPADQGQPDARFEVYGSGNKLTFSPQAITLEQSGSAAPLRLSFLGADPARQLVSGRELPTRINDYRGQAPGSWQTGGHAFASITYRELYPGIDLQYEGIEGSLKSTFHLAPGADPAQIHWQYSGAALIEVEQASGDLHVSLPDQSQIIERAPLAWQEINGQHQPVQVAYTLSTGNKIAFKLGSYDPSRTLVIDPAIEYETTLNLGYFDSGLDIATDSAGNAYVLARVYDTNNDVLIAKLTPGGALDYATYLRGSALDFGGGIAVDDAGDIYVAGGTDSADFPILNAIQPTKTNSQREGFITKLSGADGTIQFSTYFGGSRSDEIHDISLNQSGEIYVVGYTESTDFPTVNPIQSNLNLNQCFCEDTFVTQFSPDAMSVLFSTYLGGSFEDYGESIALDGNDNIYITGHTQSDDFPTLAAIQPNRAGSYQDEDLFVSKISAGDSLVYSTYLGGTDLDSIRRIAVDSAGNAYLAGSTRSIDFPTTPGAYEPNYIGGALDCGTAGFGGPVNCSDMFVTKIVPDGSSLEYSTYLGGGLDDVATGVAVNSAGEVYLVGYTSSTDFPGVTRTDPGSDIAVAKLDASGSNLLSTVIINSAVANGSNGISLDQDNNIYITAGQNAPSDLYVAKISESGSTSSPPPTNTSVPPTPTSTPIPPTPTPAPGIRLHVGDLDGSSTWVYRKWYWQAGVTIAVHDADHNPLSGVTVSGSWSGGVSGSAQCTTASNGLCYLSSENIYRRTNNVTFTVDNLSLSSYPYDPVSNHDPDGDSNGTSIVLARP